MKYAAITQRLEGKGGDKWAVYQQARALAAAGHDIVDLTIGEPDVPTPPALIDTAEQAMRGGRTGYANGRGEDGLCAALAEQYSRRLGRTISADQVMCLPGTQTSLFTVMMGLVEQGDEVVVGDPMYATYESVVGASGATLVPVPLRADRGFRLDAADIAAAITPSTRAVLLTTPHNPSGAILQPQDIAAIGALARKHDLWIISDEVYAELVFEGQTFHSPLASTDLADRVVVVSSISKSHAAPGFRSGWCVGPREFIAALLPLAEAMLFGNQPFIADMTEQAVRQGSPVAAGMRRRFAQRAEAVAQRLEAATGLTVHRPEAGMFVLINVASTGMSGSEYAWDLLENHGVAVMPGASFGDTVVDWVRLALTVDDQAIDTACERMIAHAHRATSAAPDAAAAE